MFEHISYLPSPLSIEVAQVDALLLSPVDAGYRTGDLARHECRSAPGALMIEEDTVCQVHPVGLT